MSGLFPKPADRSKLALKGHVYQGGYTLSRAGGAAGSLNVGLADFAVMFDYKPVPIPLNDTILFSKNDGATGYYLACFAWGAPQTMRLVILGGGVAVTFTTTYDRRHRFWLFFDRDANVYVYDNGILTATLNIAAGNVDQDNASAYYMLYDDRTVSYRTGDFYGSYHFNFGVGGLPDAATRALIVGQDMDNPYLVPPALSSRPNYATEERLRITFDNHDPAATVITDESPQANHLTIAGGLTCAHVLKEVMAP